MNLKKIGLALAVTAAMGFVACGDDSSSSSVAVTESECAEDDEDCIEAQDDESDDDDSATTKKKSSSSSVKKNTSSSSSSAKKSDSDDDDSKDSEEKTPAETKKCGGKSYSTAEKFCSDGTLYDLCEGEKYNPSSEFCSEAGEVESLCDGKSFDVSKKFCASSKLYDLCKGEQFDPTEEFCGKKDGKSVIAPLCGSDSYDLSEKFCKKGVLYEICEGSDSYDVTKKFCGEDKKLHSMCGGEVYDTDKKFCSDNKLYDLCGGKSYDPEKEWCYNKQEILVLCRGKEYDPTLYFCLDDVKKELCGGRTFTKDQFCDLESQKIYDKCEGNEYDVTGQFCAKDGNLRGLCGGVAYDFTGDHKNGGQFCEVEGSLMTSEADLKKPHPDGFVVAFYKDAVQGKYVSYPVALVSKVDGEYLTIKDSRDQNEYKTTYIGNKIWMTENLKFDSNDLVSGSRSLINDKKFGTSYYYVFGQFDQIVDQLCPDGFLIPSVDDFDTLKTQMGEIFESKINNSTYSPAVLLMNEDWDDLVYASAPADVKKYFNYMKFNAVPMSSEIDDENKKSAMFWTGTSYAEGAFHGYRNYILGYVSTKDDYVFGNVTEIYGERGNKSAYARCVMDYDPILK